MEREAATERVVSDVGGTAGGHRFAEHDIDLRAVGATGRTDHGGGRGRGESHLAVGRDCQCGGLGSVLDVIERDGVGGLRSLLRGGERDRPQVGAQRRGRDGQALVDGVVRRVGGAVEREGLVEGNGCCAPVGYGAEGADGRGLIGCGRGADDVGDGREPGVGHFLVADSVGMQIVRHVAQLEIGVHVEKMDAASQSLLGGDLGRNERVGPVGDGGVVRLAALHESGDDDMRTRLAERDARDESVKAVDGIREPRAAA